MSHYCYRQWIKVCLRSLAIVFSLPVVSQTKIAVLSDIHVMNPELVVNDGTAWQNALGGERKLLDYSAEIYDVLVEKFLTDKPDMLFITGDLTKDGELASHQYVLAGLEKLREAGIKTYVIPGNHDRGTSNAYYFDGENKTKAEVADDAAFQQMYANYGYDAAFARESTTLSYACEPVEGMVLIGIDSGNAGTLSETTLGWVCNQARNARRRGKQVVAMMHHPLFSHVTNMEKMMGTYRVNDFENVRDRLIDAGIHVILTGHVHFSDIAKDFNTALNDSVYDINTGSTISYPCDYRELTLSSDLSRLTVNTGHVSTLPSDADFSNTAKNRLKTFIQKYGSSMFGNNELFLNILTNMILIHAEGNENKSIDAKSLINLYKLGAPILKNNASITAKLTARGMTWDDAEATLNSMLKDISNYGVTGHENQTNDLQLTIYMPPVSAEEWLRGDVDKNGVVNISDVIMLVRILFDENVSYVMDTADLDGNGLVNVTDVTCLINILLEYSSD